MQSEDLAGAGHCTGDVGKATHLRTMAVYCVQMALRCLLAAEQLSLEVDRARMMEIAERWSDLARQAEIRSK
jgi:hypothetical protein